MTKLPPIYKEHGKTYKADTCAPVVEAVKAGRLVHHALVHGHYPGRRLAKNVLPGVLSLGFWDAKRDQDWGLEWHRNEGIELTFLESGRLPFAADSREYVLHPDDLTITRPWQPHRIGNPRVTAGRLHFLILDLGVRRPHQTWHWPDWVVLTKTDLQQLTRMFRQNERAVWHVGADIRRSFQQIAHSVETNRSGSNISRLTVQLNELLLLLLETFRHHRVRLDESLSSAQRTVELFWTDVSGDLDILAMPWTLKSMARRCGLGVTHFVHQTKQLKNMTPVEYLNCRRAQAAALLLLEEPQRSVLDIALACSFSSSQYFATVFRRHFGCSPREYRSNPPCSTSSAEGY